MTVRALFALLSIAWSVDGALIATGESDKTALVREVATGATVREWTELHAVSQLQWSPDGALIYSGSLFETKGYLREAGTGTMMREWTHEGDVYAIGPVDEVQEEETLSDSQIRAPVLAR